MFAKGFLVCLLTVAWKLRAPGFYTLDCVGEELALRAVVERASAMMELAGKEADFVTFGDLAFEDMDFELLFDREMAPVIRDEEAARRLGLANLLPEQWFEPFRDESPVHPYVEG